MKITKPETAKEYMAIAEQFTWLADAELRRIEEVAQSGDLSTVARRLPGIISIVNSVGYLRGQDNFFHNDRPRDLTSDDQKQLYAAEDEIEARLWALIELVFKNQESLEEYLASMNTYYIFTRTAKEHRVSPDAL